MHQLLTLKGPAHKAGPFFIDIKKYDDINSSVFQ
jgi:hypothetical protein